MFARSRIAALAAEFLGTAILAFLVLTVSRSNIGLPFFVALASGIGIIVLGLALARNLQLNPAYTFALWTARRQSFVKTLGFILAQVLGGVAAYSLYKYLQVTGTVQGLPTEYNKNLLVGEAAGAFVFAFVVAAVAYRQVEGNVRYVVTGGAYALGLMVASVAVSQMHPAVFINPVVAMASNAWAPTTYVLGPILGALLGVNLYGALFAGRGTAVAAATATGSTRPVSTSSLIVEATEEKAKEDPKPAKTVKAKAEKPTVKAAKPRKTSGRKKK